MDATLRTAPTSHGPRHRTAAAPSNADAAQEAGSILVAMVREPLVLVVDDYAEAREMYVAWLEVSGYRVAKASTAAEALALARTEPPDAILMDLSLPGVDGLEATRQLKSQSETAHVPVLAITGHVEAHVAEAACAAGCDAFIVKPSPAPDVVRVIGELIARRHAFPAES
jgi:two-component system, cell cycle response regulator DivK